MNKNKHLIPEERNIIEQRLNEKKSFRSIACELGKDPTTIAKEVKNHIQFKKTGCYGRPFNDCLIRRDCATQHLCSNRKCNRYCCFCKSHSCSSICPDYQQQICYRLTKPPYVCNGCDNRRSCTLEKRTYSAIRAQKEYEAVRTEARQGIQLTEDEALRLDALLSPKDSHSTTYALTMWMKSCSMNVPFTITWLMVFLQPKTLTCLASCVWET